jgi:hypothetical protein
MMMAVDDDEIDHREFDSRRNDTTPLMALVRDKPYSRGTLTSEGRTASREYQAFLERNRNGRGK